MKLEWTKCSDALPQENRPCLVTSQDGGTVFGGTVCLENGRWRTWAWDDRHCRQDFGYWIYTSSIPTPYQIAQEAGK